MDEVIAVGEVNPDHLLHPTSLLTSEFKTSSPGTDIEQLSNVDKDGVVIAVMGLTGVGKSHFIARLGGYRFKTTSTATVGHTLDPRNYLPGYYACYISLTSKRDERD
jgi:predicted GTPase